jgi:ribose transport system substrate-binding protein
MAFLGKFQLASVTGLVALLATACGGSSATTSSAATAGPGSKECVDQAQALVAAARVEADLQIGAPFDMAKNKGKTLWVINAARTPFLQQISDGAKAAGDAAGLKVQLIYGDGTAAASQAAIQQAVAQKAAAIALVVIDPATVKPGIAAAKQAGIPVIDVLNRTSGAPVPEGLAGQSVAQLQRSGEALAGWMLADSGCDANVLIYRASALPIHVTMAETAEAKLTELCPKCEVTVKELDLGKFSNTLTAEVQTEVRRKPNTNYVFPVLDAAVPFVDAGLRGLSDEIKVVSHDGVAQNLSAMRKGSSRQLADMSFAPAAALGWSVTDQMARILVGEDAKELVLPTRLVDKTNIGADDAGLFPAYADFEGAYKKSWGAQS